MLPSSHNAIYQLAFSAIPSIFFTFFYAPPQNDVFGCRCYRSCCLNHMFLYAFAYHCSTDRSGVSFKNNKFCMLWRTIALQTIGFISPQRGFIKKHRVLICVCAPLLSKPICYKPAAGSYLKTKGFKMFLRTTALRTIIFISTLRGLIQKQ